MVWKQDLAKLKQQLKEEGPPAQPPPTALARRPDKPAESRPLEEEDALFLQSMGRKSEAGARPAEARPAEARPAEARPLPAGPASAPAPPPLPEPDLFAKAMGSMKGMKPLDGPPPLPAPVPAVVPAAVPASTPAAAAPKPPLISQLLAASEETRPLDAPPPPPEAVKVKGPVLIQLAAGMAIDVDGLLDLRNHTLTDARERLKERLEDAVLLGWRSMHVLLGPSEALRQGFLAFLTTPAARSVQRYAQAPVPMGGSQAWVLYLGPSS